jgi:hypothetical protein
MIARNADLQPIRTLGELFVRSERVHDRPFALRAWRKGKPESVPDWRLHRQILRMAIYLREREGVQAGDSIAIVASLGPRSIVLEWGAVLLGATVALLDPRQLEVPGVLDVLRARRVFDEVAFWSQALELGGTLDTAERAQSIRGAARAIEPGAPALSYLEGTNGTTSWAALSHADAVARVRSVWSLSSQPREVTVPVPRETTLSARLALYAYVGDGRTRVAFPEDEDDLKRGESRHEHDRRTGP